MNPAVAALKPSLIRTLHDAKRPGDLDLGLGQPLDRPSIAAFEAATRWVAEHGCPYTPNAGDHELRALIAGQIKGPQIKGDENVVVTLGSQEAIYLVIKALLEPGKDEALIASPAYGAYAKVCQLEGVAYRSVPFDAADGFRPTAQSVLEALTPATRLVILASPINPTGRVWSAQEGRALCEALSARPGPPVHLLVDSVYEALSYHDDPADFASLYPHTLISSGLSKSHALTGLRLGWLAGPAGAMALAVKVHQQVCTASSTFSQRVAIEILKQPGAFSDAQRLWASRRAEASQILTATLPDHAPLEGAFYAFVRLPEGHVSSLSASRRLIEVARVVTVPGVAFGPSGEGWLRLSYAGEPEVLREGAGRIAEALRP